MSAVRWVDSETLLEDFGFSRAIAAISEVLESGYDPEIDHSRSVINFAEGQGLVMPSEYMNRVGLKIVTVAPNNPASGLDRIQGIYTLFDAQTLSPILQCDGATLTLLRTASVTAAIVKKLLSSHKPSVALFGSGPQAFAHMRALAASTGVGKISLFARNPESSQRLVADLTAQGFDISIGSANDLLSADLVLTLTTSREPLFEESQVSPTAVIAALGSHEATARELPGELMGSGVVYIESTKSALTEAGDVIMAIDEGHIEEADLVKIRQLFSSTGPNEFSGRKVFKSTGMSWQDLAVVRALEKSLAL
jgi:ornithine cyclodeaminase/alanine dehydrogenase-like protein (mu-crystallin family)